MTFATSVTTCADSRIRGAREAVSLKQWGRPAGEVHGWLRILPGSVAIVVVHERSLA
jgi:hypothetical protein